MNDSDFSSLGLQNGDLVFVKYERDHGRSGKISYCALGLFYMFQPSSSYFEVYVKAPFLYGRGNRHSEGILVEQVVDVKKLMTVDDVKKNLEGTGGLNGLSGIPAMGTDLEKILGLE